MKRFPACCWWLAAILMVVYLSVTGKSPYYYWDSTEYIRRSIGISKPWTHGQFKSWEKARQEMLSAPNSTARVLLLAYVRGGSSVGGEMFNQDPRSLLWYEPLDAFYSAYYGFGKETPPQKLVLLPNGTTRTLPYDEQKYVTNFLRNLLSCDLQNLPPEALSHYFLAESSAMDEYWTCFTQRARELGLRDLYDTCKSYIGHLCGQTLQAAANKQCHLYLDLTRVLAQLVYSETDPGRARHALLADLLKLETNLPEEVAVRRARSFANHALCMNNVTKQLIAPCVGKAEAACRGTSVRAAEVTRLRVPEVERLIQEVPDIHVVYYVRDPRAIVNSRLQTRSLLWDPRDRRHETEASVLCPRLLEDIRAVHRLREKYRGVIQVLRYEDLVADPRRTAERVYAQLGRQPSRQWTEFARQSMHDPQQTNKGGTFGIRVRDARVVAQKWRQEIPADQIQALQTICAEVLKELHYDFV